MSSVFPQDSLAAEIEGTMRKELQLEELESPDITYDLVAFIFQVPSN
jgi:trafficking kinesin-binding protein 1